MTLAFYPNSKARADTSPLIKDQPSDSFSRIEKKKRGVPVMSQLSLNLTGIYEDTSSIPGLAQWVKDPVLL